MIQKTYKTIFFGTPDFSLPVLQALASLGFIKLLGVVTQPDQPAGRKQALTPPPVKMRAEKIGLQVWQPASLKNKLFTQQFESAAPDLCIVVAYGKIIPSNLLGMPPHGWLNVHASLLPKYRGASPIQAAILAGEEATGVTLMKIDAGLDTGPIIDQIKMELNPQENFQTLHDRLGQLGADIIKKSLLPYLTGQLQPQPQDNKQATLTKIISKENGRVDWKKSAVEIDRQIRAYTPWPGAYCFWTPAKTNAIELRLKILAARPVDGTKQLQAGQTGKQENRIVVGCGHGTLALNFVQLEGKKPLPIREFILGCPEFTQTVLS
ncbi:MAG: methionyl-tRNA formyltransferase [Patescibacteria group bacterium]